ncbi:glutathione S-transferase Mu 1-like [Pholidichthys leucotaenia]
MPMKLAYWDVRGFAHPIRYLLEYTGEPYEEKFYSCGEAPDYDKSCWLNEKFKLGMDFPNLPYLFDGDMKVSQSSAILRYIARKHNVCHFSFLNVNSDPTSGGETVEEKTRVDMLENQIVDFRTGFVMLCYLNYDEKKDEYLKTLPASLKQFSDFLGCRKWFAGDKITYVDFMMYEVLDQHRKFQPSCLDNFKNLKDLIARFEALEKISAYVNSSRFRKLPIHNRMAKWGNKP